MIGELIERRKYLEDKIEADKALLVSMTLTDSTLKTLLNNIFLDVKELETTISTILAKSFSTNVNTENSQMNLSDMISFRNINYSKIHIINNILKENSSAIDTNFLLELKTTLYNEIQYINQFINKAIWGDPVGN